MTFKVKVSGRVIQVSREIWPKASGKVVLPACRTHAKLGRSLALPFESQAGRFQAAARLISESRANDEAVFEIKATGRPNSVNQLTIEGIPRLNKAQAKSLANLVGLAKF